MTVRKSLGIVAIVACLIMGTIIMYPIHRRLLLLRNGQQETSQQIQPPAKKPYEVHYYPNRTVIRITGPAREMGKALSDIKEKYNVEEVLPRGIAPIEDLTIIAVPEDPNSPSS